MLSRDEFYKRFPNGPLNFKQRQNRSVDAQREKIANDILAELRGERADEIASQRAENLYRALADGVEYIQGNQKRRQQFEKAGVPGNMIDDDLGLIMGRDANDQPIASAMLETGLDVNVPAPYVGDDGLRVFARQKINPVTGQKQIVPFIDDEQPDRALSIHYGQRVGPDELASELVEKTILKLMGGNARFYAGTEKVNNKSTNWRSDFKADINGKRAHVDGMMSINGATKFKHKDKLFRTTEVIPAYMNVWPKGHTYNAIQDYDLAKRVDQLIREEMSAGPYDVVEATDRLLERGVLEGPAVAEHGLGKLLRNDPDRLPREDQYDYLIDPGFNVIEATNQKDEGGKLLAPERVHLIDLAKVRANLHKHRGDVKNLYVKPNNDRKYGRKKDQDSAYPAKVMQRFRLDEEGFEDVLKNPRYASVHQAMRELNLKE